MTSTGNLFMHKSCDISSSIPYKNHYQLLVSEKSTKIKSLESEIDLLEKTKLSLIKDHVSDSITKKSISLNKAKQGLNTIKEHNSKLIKDNQLILKQLIQNLSYKETLLEKTEADLRKIEQTRLGYLKKITEKDEILDRYQVKLEREIRNWQIINSQLKIIEDNIEMIYKEKLDIEYTFFENIPKNKNSFGQKQKRFEHLVDLIIEKELNIKKLENQISIIENSKKKLTDRLKFEKSEIENYQKLYKSQVDEELNLNTDIKNLQEEIYNLRNEKLLVTVSWDMDVKQDEICFLSTKLGISNLEHQKSCEEMVDLELEQKLLDSELVR